MTINEWNVNTPGRGERHSGQKYEIIQLVFLQSDSGTIRNKQQVIHEIYAGQRSNFTGGETALDIAFSGRYRVGRKQRINI